ncbi:GNAT family N-acetyltransferase [Falsirhodobacter sp. alg1]|uniref:GNAT family N-acetyltransferase n=1 Tax=Falsirhodobacter sp. alg1 TaxID=1472418 RepID=UPI0005F07BC3|nr:GNAT family N-acetyltransferase [Falsirhodobacter sp. alg1]
MIRPATLADAPQIRALWNAMITDSLANFSEVEKTPAEVETAIRERPVQGFAVFVAEEEGEITGFSTYAQFRPGHGYRLTMEHTIATNPRFKGRGIGRALMKAVEDHARAMGAHSMLAAITAQNSDGVSFHEALGYQHVALVPRAGYKWGQWLDLVLMQKFL